MSYTFNGRYTHSYEQYQRWQSEAAAEEEARAARALASEATRLRGELQSTRSELEQSRNDVRAAARAQAKLSAQQDELRTVQARMSERQAAYEQQSRQRQEELASEIQASEQRVTHQVAAAEQRANTRIDAARRESEERSRALQNELTTLRSDVQQGFDALHTELAETEKRLERNIDGVRADLAAEREARMQKEATKTARARALVDLLRGRLEKLPSLDSIGLTVEKGRVATRLAQAEEILAGNLPEEAFGIAQAALVDLETATTEQQRRIGVIEGTAAHIEETVNAIERITQDKDLRTIFERDVERLDAAVKHLRDKTASWKSKLPWTLFECERDQKVEAANMLLALASELQGLTPAVLAQLTRREGLLKEAAAAIRTLHGHVDKFETGYADEGDVKSPRLLRAHIGAVRIETYIELNGSFKTAAYGYPSRAACNSAFAQMDSALNAKWQITSGAHDPSNPAHAPSAPGPAPEAWRGLGTAIAKKAGSLGD